MTPEVIAELMVDFRKQFVPFLPPVGEITEATAFRLRHKNRGAEWFHEYPVLARRRVPLVQAERLVRMLNAVENYGPEGGGCFDPGLGLRVIGTKGSFDVVICFACHELESHVGKERGEEPLSIEGIQRFHAEFKALFPGLEPLPKQLW